MNAVPLAHASLDRVLPLFNEAEREAELACYRGENPEQIDWFASSKEFKKAPPPVPFENIISTELQCEGETEEYPGPCLKSYDIYEETEREVAQQWPEGSYRQVEVLHVILLDKPEVAINAVKRVASK